MSEEIKKCCNGKILKWVMLGAAAFALLLAVFVSGLSAGFHKANFNCRWGENYNRNFGGPMPGFNQPRKGIMGKFREDYINPNGLTGTVIGIASGTLQIKGNDNIERSIIISSTTQILKGRGIIGVEGIFPDDKAVIIGAPSSSGQIEAKFIRIFENK